MTTIYPGAARPHETEPGTGQLSRRLLGKTAWSVNPIGIGTWSMGGAWGAIDDGASRQALRVAVAEGVDFFDTADNYGCGHGEVLLGEVLSALGRNKPYVATKIGRRANASPPWLVALFCENGVVLRIELGAQWFAGERPQREPNCIQVLVILAFTGQNENPRMKAEFVQSPFDLFRWDPVFGASDDHKVGFSGRN